MARKDIWEYYLVKIDGRFPLVKKEFPKAKYMDAGGNKFQSLIHARRFRKRQQDYIRRKNKPRIKLIVS